MLGGILWQALLSMDSVRTTERGASIHERSSSKEQEGAAAQIGSGFRFSEPFRSFDPFESYWEALCFLRRLHTPCTSGLCFRSSKPLSSLRERIALVDAHHMVSLVRLAGGRDIHGKRFPHWQRATAAAELSVGQQGAELMLLEPMAQTQVMHYYSWQTGRYLPALQAPHTIAHISKQPSPFASGPYQRATPILPL